MAVLCSALLAGCGAGMVGGGLDSDLPGVEEQLAPPDTDDERAAFSVSKGEKARVVNTGGLGLRLRSGPGLDHRTLDVIPERAIVEVIGGPSSGWYKVEHQDQTGWSYGVYLASVKATEAEPQEPADENQNLLPYRRGKRFHMGCGHGCYAHKTVSYWAWDFGMPVGTDIVASHAGTVRLVKRNSTTGGCSSKYGADANYVVIAKGNGIESLYVHLGKVFVHQGQKVARGELIAHSGETGWSCGAHLHFQFQHSPVNGSGSSSHYNQSVHRAFYDSGSALDPHAGDWPLSRNGPPGASPFSSSGGAGGPEDSALTDFQNGAPGEYDRLMQQATADE